MLGTMRPKKEKIREMMILRTQFSFRDTRKRKACQPGPGHLVENETIYEGLRCSIVTFAALSASFGRRVIAVAPLPMITTLLPE